MTRKEAATTFLKMVVGGDVAGAYEKFIATEFKHHNQYFKGDRHTLLQAMDEANTQNPIKKFEIKKVYEDGETVITHSFIHLTQDDMRMAVIHIFRFQGDKVVELWDLGEQLLKDSPNENGPF